MYKNLKDDFVIARINKSRNNASKIYDNSEQRNTQVRQNLD